jgi:AcrR family transcriptional regulator
MLVSTNPRQHLSSRQALTVDRLTRSAVDEVREQGYAGLTVRNVAARAGVAPATAYNYFTSKDHLITEVFWRRLAALPETRHDGRQSSRTRLHATLADIALLVADEPELAAACSVAMLGPDPDVRHLCDRIGLEMHRRVADALGPDVHPTLLRALDLVLTGALVQAGMGHLAYTDLPDLLAEVSTTLLGGT